MTATKLNRALISHLVYRMTLYCSVFYATLLTDKLWHGRERAALFEDRLLRNRLNRMKLEPAHVLVTRHGQVGDRRAAVGHRARIQRRRGSAVQPMLDGRMPIRKCETGGK